MAVDFWEGQSEQWLKWIYSIQPSLDTSKEISQEQPWISVQKNQWQRHHQGVSIELTRIVVEFEPWWSIALEATPRTTQPDLWFSQRVSDISQTYRGPALLAHQCYGYPTWLAKHCIDPSPSLTSLPYSGPSTVPYSIETHHSPLTYF